MPGLFRYGRMAVKTPTNFAAEALGDEAKGYDPSSSDTRVCSAEWFDWLQVPPVSGAECVRVLRRAGFSLQPGQAGCADLQRNGEVVRVPLTERLGPDVLIAILIKAGVGPARFLALLDY